jgi:hypothetical protein
MRWILILLLAMPSLMAQSDEREAIAAIEKLFKGMSAHDAELIRSVMLPDAQIFAVRDDGAPTSRGAKEFVDMITASKNALLERFTGRPTVSIRGRMAQVWAEYEFLRDGKFSHCGVDSVSLFKTAEGWKIATVVYTAETTGCKSSK